MDDLQNGDAIFPAMLEAIRGARRNINFETYIYWSGEIGQQFADVQDTKDQLNSGGYLADDALATTVFLQTRLAKPLLIEGPAGVGKTQLATSLAQITGRRLLRLQCYEGQDESKALYEWDYGKQLLYTQILREKITELVGDTRTLDEATVTYPEVSVVPGAATEGADS